MIFKINKCKKIPADEAGIFYVSAFIFDVSKLFHNELGILSGIFLS